ncbi:hypothetical protein ACLOJK_024942 [Asimina triloba]
MIMRDEKAIHLKGFVIKLVRSRIFFCRCWPETKRSASPLFALNLEGRGGVVAAVATACRLTEKKLSPSLSRLAADDDEDDGKKLSDLIELSVGDEDGGIWIVSSSSCFSSDRISRWNVRQRSHRRQSWLSALKRAMEHQNWCSGGAQNMAF